MSTPNALGTIEARQNYAFATEQTFYGLSPITLQALNGSRLRALIPRMLFCSCKESRLVVCLCSATGR
jgi:hypothetical protein